MGYSLAKLYKRDRGICHICGKRVNSLQDASRDHIIPRHLGGTNGINGSNLALAHRQCNARKGHNVFRAEQHGSGFVIVDPKGEVVSDEYPTLLEAQIVAADLNSDRIYLDEHYELAREIAEDVNDFIIFVNR